METKSKSFSEQSVISNLKFWGKRAEKTFLFFVLIVLFYTFFMSLTSLSSGENGAAEVARQFRIYAVIMGLMLPLIGINSFGVPGIGIAMSFGARRSETIWGIQFMAWLLAIQIFLFVAVGNWLTGGSFKWMGIYLLLLITGVGAGELMGCASMKFGWKGALLTVLFYCAAAIGGGVLFICKGGLILILNGETGKLFLPLLLVAVLLCVAGALCWKKILSVYEVKV